MISSHALCAAASLERQRFVMPHSSKFESIKMILKAASIEWHFDNW